MSELSRSTPEPSAVEVPLAPPVEPAKKSHEPTALAVRLWCGLVFLICGGMLGLGLWLTPNPRGYGTHQQLGLPPCGFQTQFGIPCPTCSCTTAVSHFAHGQLIASFVTQPFGFTVAAVAFMAVAFSLAGIVTGRWYGPSMFYISWYWQYWFYGSIGILLVAWGYKILLARLGHS